MRPLSRHSIPAESRALLVRPRRAVITPDFTFVWWGQVVSQIGDGVTKLALLWFVYSITGSAMKTSVIGLLQTLPPILFGPIIGVYLDRLPKKPILIGTDLLRAVLIGLIPCWVPSETFTVVLLYLLVGLHAVATTIFGPALTASIPLLVPRNRFTAANALLQSTTSLGIVVGPALSGLGIAAFSSQDVLCVNAVTYVVSAVCFMPVRFPRVLPEATAKRRWRVFHDLIAGFRFTLVRQPTLLLLILTAAVHTFATAALSTLFPVFGRHLLDLGPIEIGYLWSSFGVGLLLISLTLIPLSAWDLAQRIGIIAIASVVTAGGMAGLPWAPDRLTATLLMVAIGASVGVFTPIAWGVVQEVSPDSMLGRSLTIYTMGSMVAAIIGMTVFGWVTEVAGTRASVFGISAVMLLAAIMAFGFGRWIRRQRLRLAG